MNFQINLVEMKKKIEIEDGLLYTINKNLQEYTQDLNYIKNNYTFMSYDYDTKSIKNNYTILTLNYLIFKYNESHKYIMYHDSDNQTNLNKLLEKIFNHIEQTYNIFLCFYYKKKDYMVMNLTGLIDGKMETGLGLRSNIIKTNINGIKDDNLKQIIYSLNNDNINIYKIKSHLLKLDEFNLESFSYLYIIANLTTQKYFVILEK